MDHERITRSPKVADGRPCIRDTGVTVATVLALLAGGAPPRRIVAAYPELELADIDAAMWYAAWRMEESAPP